MSRAVDEIDIDTTAPAHPFPHFWEKMLGSGRAVLALRDSYRHDLREVKRSFALDYLRFHAIFHDELGVYGEDGTGTEIYNFQYIDQIYDGLLAEGVRPFVELSFMPRELAARLDVHPFWYRPIVSPPKDYRKWDELIERFAHHLVDRYGIEEVANWYFEVWNEPNFDFWSGRPAQATYFELYDHTARALKRVNARLRVGGPATAATAWVGAMIEHAVRAQVPLDFISTHVYGNEDPRSVVGHDVALPPYGLVCAAVKKAHDEIAASRLPGLPLIFSEFNVTSDPKSPTLDDVFMGPWLADTIRRCDGLLDILSYWTFSDVFEEGGVLRRPFQGGYGLIALHGIPKPSFEAMRLLHRLGTRRLDNAADNVLVTRRDDGGLVIAAWNIVPPGTSGAAKSMRLHIRGLAPAREARIERVDSTHGDTTSRYREMGEPAYPSLAQIEELRQVAQPVPAERAEIHQGRLELSLPENGLALVEIGN